MRREWHAIESLCHDLCRACGLLFLGNDGQLDAPVRRQECVRGRADVRRRERAVPRQVFVEPVGIAGAGVVAVQLVGLAAESADALHPVVERRFDLVQRPLHFARGRRLALELGDLLVDDLLELLDRVPRPRRGLDQEVRGQRREIPGKPGRSARSACRRRAACTAASSCRPPAPTTTTSSAASPGAYMTRRQPGEVEPRQLHAVGDRLLLHAGQRHARNRHRLGRAVPA